MALPFSEGQAWGGGAKMAKEEDGETTFSPTNSSKEHLNAEQTPQNNFWSLAEDIGAQKSNEGHE